MGNINIRNVSFQKIKWRNGDKITLEISTLEICQRSKMKRLAQTVIS